MQFYASLGLMLTVIFLLIVLPILLWSKMIAIAIVIVLLVRIVTRWVNAQNQILLFNPETGYWQLDGAEECKALRLKPDQFVTSGLVIIYFETPEGSVIKRFITRDVVSVADHHRLRVLLLARSH
jgi:hypothetical protein|tara:strand:+ start:141 stop:515 length:375 start_codon:yes stop_codon:yes gene_type:complete